MEKPFGTTHSKVGVDCIRRSCRNQIMPVHIDLLKKQIDINEATVCYLWDALGIIFCSILLITVGFRVLKLG